MKIKIDDDRLLAYIKSKGDVSRDTILSIDRDTMWNDDVEVCTMNKLIILQNKLKRDEEDL